MTSLLEKETSSIPSNLTKNSFVWIPLEVLCSDFTKVDEGKKENVFSERFSFSKNVDNMYVCSDWARYPPYATRGVLPQVYVFLPLFSAFLPYILHFHCCTLSQMGSIFLKLGFHNLPARFLKISVFEISNNVLALFFLSNLCSR